jgi:hypothetical protein
MRNPCYLCVAVFPYVCVFVFSVTARQRSLLFYERSSRPFSIGALTVQSSGPPLPPFSHGD